MKYFKLLFFAICIFFYSLNSDENIIYLFKQFSEQKNITLSEKQNNIFNRGLTQFKKENYLRATEIFADLCLEKPGHPLLNIYLMASLFSIKEYELAGKTTQRLINQYNNWNNIPLDFSKIFNKDYFGNLNLFEKWLYENPEKDIESYLLYGFLCQFSNRLNKAELAYKMVLKKDFLYKEVYSLLNLKKPYPNIKDVNSKIESSLKKNNHDELLNNISNLCFCYPEIPENFYNLCFALAIKKEFKKSKSVLLYSLKTFLNDEFPEQKKLLFDIAKITTDLEQHLKFSKSQKAILFLLAFNYKYLGQKDKLNLALKHLDNLLTSEEIEELNYFKKVLANKIKNNIIKNHKKIEKQVKDIKIEKLKNKDKNIFFKQGKEAFLNRKYKKSLEYLVKSIIQNPEDLESQWLLILSNFTLGNYQQTYRMIKETLKRNPNYDLNIDDYFINKTEYSYHLKKLAAWIKKNADDDSAIFILATLLYFEKKYYHSYQIFKRLEKRLPNDKDIKIFIEIIKEKL